MTHHFDPDLPDDDEDLEHRTDTEASVTCPYCGEHLEISLDPGSGAVQDYVEDCQVCCQPWRVMVTYHRDGHADVAVEQADDS
jgi:hypothetical protein